MLDVVVGEGRGYMLGFSAGLRIYNVLWAFLGPERHCYAVILLG